MFKIPEIMTTELFWGPMLAVIILFLMAAIIIVACYRCPEIYRKDHRLKKEEIKVGEENISNRAAQ